MTGAVWGGGEGDSRVCGAHPRPSVSFVFFRIPSDPTLANGAVWRRRGGAARSIESQGGEAADRLGGVAQAEDALWDRAGKPSRRRARVLHDPLLPRARPRARPCGWRPSPRPRPRRPRDATLR